MWAAGVAGASGIVASWRIVGPGYTWLTGATVALIGAGAWLLDDAIGSAIGVIFALAAVVLARNPRAASIALLVSSAGLLVSAAQAGSTLLAVSGAVGLGGVTAEMLLGHWYLVSPQMPRWALKRLAAVALGGLTIDAVFLVVLAVSRQNSDLGMWVFGGLALTSVGLMVAVWFALKEPSYPGVMAATGLSYLAVLTSLGAVAVGRALLGGDSSFLPLQ